MFIHTCDYLLRNPTAICKEFSGLVFSYFSVGGCSQRPRDFYIVFRVIASNTRGPRFDSGQEQFNQRTSICLVEPFWLLFILDKINWHSIVPIYVSNGSNLLSQQHNNLPQIQHQIVCQTINLSYVQICSDKRAWLIPQETILLQLHIYTFNFICKLAPP